MGKKIIVTIISLLLISALGFCVCWTVINFGKVKDGLSGTAIYTKEDVEKAYYDGYDKALNDKDDLLLQIEELRFLLSEKETELHNLEVKLSDYNLTKSELNALKHEQARLEKEVSNLKLSLKTYEEFVEEIKLADKKVVTYEYDGYTFGLQRYNEGETLSLIENPVDTENIKFLGWTLDGETVIDLTNYTVTDNVTFIAKISKSLNVNFLADGEIYVTQKVAEFGSCTLPLDTPDKYGYNFKGWSTDGVTVLNDIENEVITEDISYIAVFELFEVQISFKCVYIPSNFLIGNDYLAYEVLTDIPWEVPGNVLYFGYRSNAYEFLEFGTLNTSGDYSSVLREDRNIFIINRFNIFRDYCYNNNITTDIYSGENFTVTFYLLPA